MNDAGGARPHDDSPDNRLSWPALWLWLGCGAVALASCDGLGVVGTGPSFWMFWGAAACGAAAFQFGVAPRRAGQSVPGWPEAGWLAMMVGAGLATAFGGCAAVLGSGAVMAHTPAPSMLANVGTVAVVVGIAWGLGAIVLMVLKAAIVLWKLCWVERDDSNP
jgi:hypothetical protein